MKTATAILVLALLFPSNITAGRDPAPDPKVEAVIVAPIMLGILVLGATVVGVYCVVTVNSTLPSDKSPVTLSLQKSEDHATWTTVCTKTVTLNGTNAVEFFREEMTDQYAFYRVKKAQ